MARPLRGLRTAWGRLDRVDRAYAGFFLLLGVLILAFHGNLPHWPAHLARQAAAAAAVLLVVPLIRARPDPVSRLLCLVYPVAALPFAYGNMAPLIHLVVPGELDPWIVGLETRLFGTLPNHAVLAWVHPATTELFQVCYAFFWLMVPAGALAVYLCGDKEVYHAFLFRVTAVFLLSFLGFVLVPVSGPRFHLPREALDLYRGLWVTDALRGFMRTVAFRGGAFPSSHVAAAVVVLFFVRRVSPPLGRWVFGPAALGLTLATVYGQYHYVTDVVAGLALALFLIRREIASGGKTREDRDRAGHSALTKPDGCDK